MKTARVISEEDIVPNRAAGYRVVDGELKNQEWVAPSWNTTADVSLYLTLMDLAKWDAALIGNKLLNDATKRLAWAPTSMNDGTVVNHGFGWFIGDEPQRLVETSGGWQGFRNHIARYLKDSISVIVLSNSASVEPTRVAHRVAALHDARLAPVARKAIALSASELQEYEGAYRVATGDTIRLRRLDDGLGLQGIAPVQIRFRPHAKDAFFLEGTESRLVFVRDKNTQRIRWMRLLRVSSMPNRAKKIS
jgi:beta-lactamase family protein